MKYQFLYNEKYLLQSVFDFFTSKVTNEEYFKEIESFCSTHSVLNKIDNHDKFLSLGHFIKEDFKIFMIEHKKKTIAINILDLALDALVENSILNKLEPNTIFNPKTQYFPNVDIARFYKFFGLL